MEQWGQIRNLPILETGLQRLAEKRDGRSTAGLWSVCAVAFGKVGSPKPAERFNLRGWFPIRAWVADALKVIVGKIAADDHLMVFEFGPLPTKAFSDMREKSVLAKTTDRNRL